MDYKFQKGIYKEQFSDYVGELIEQDLTIEKRCNEIELLTERYVEFAGKKPNPFELERLANYLLKEHLQDKNPDKITAENYPVLSERQTRSRKSKEFIKDEGILDYIKLKKSNKHQNLNKKNTSESPI